jgi:hypothetical protein
MYEVFELLYKRFDIAQVMISTLQNLLIINSDGIPRFSRLVLPVRSAHNFTSTQPFQFRAPKWGARVHAPRRALEFALLAVVAQRERLLMALRCHTSQLSVYYHNRNGYQVSLARMERMHKARPSAIVDFFCQISHSALTAG